jgi:hypothetical protein
MASPPCCRTMEARQRGREARRLAECFDSARPCLHPDQSPVVGLVHWWPKRPVPSLSRDQAQSSQFPRHPSRGRALLTGPWVSQSSSRTRQASVSMATHRRMRERDCGLLQALAPASRTSQNCHSRPLELTLHHPFFLFIIKPKTSKLPCGTESRVHSPSLCFILERFCTSIGCDLPRSYDLCICNAKNQFCKKYLYQDLHLS